jgi:peptide/nickel transport system ATP-binding protein
VSTTDATTTPAAASRPTPGTAPLLQVTDLHTTFDTPRGPVRAVDGVSLELAAGETIGIVGESGSGKSVFVRSVMGLSYHVPNARVDGSIKFEGRELTGLSKADWRRIWGKEIAMIFQDPMTSLNPVKKIGAHFTQPLRQHLNLGRKEARDRAAELLTEVGIPEPVRRLDQYPHELSGGMRQRVCIALALACRPKLLIADEPTTALDVTVQRQILDLLAQVTSDTGMATVLITHDLGVVARRAQRIIVMYAGEAVEEAPVRPLFHRTSHPYAEALLASVPRLAYEPHTRLAAIPGTPPNLAVPIQGCPFEPRCSYATDVCREVRPVLEPSPADPEHPSHTVACHHPVTVATTPAPVGGER